MNAEALLGKHSTCPASSADGRTDLVAEEEGHPGLVSGVSGDVANELQHGRDPWNTADRPSSLPPRCPLSLVYS